MDKIFGQNDPKMANYAEEVFQPEDDILREIRKRSEEKGLPEIQVGSMDGLHLEVLARGMGAKKIVEIGTLGGYSGVCLARALGEGGRLYTFEVNADNARVAKDSFAKAGFEEKVEIFVGPALQNLTKIENLGPFDLVFIDADKASYPKYLSWAAVHLRVGGSVLGDNTFGWGQVADSVFSSPDKEISIRALNQFNKDASCGGRFKATILPTGEGLTLAVKIR